MDIPTEAMLRTQKLGNSYQLLHGVIGALDHSGTQEQPFDVIALVKLDGEEYDFCRCEARSLGIARNAVNAVAAVVNAVIRQQ